jgi:hypothetical protein
MENEMRRDEKRQKGRRERQWMPYGVERRWLNQEDVRSEEEGEGLAEESLNQGATD